ncbi:DUF2461 domain-containing protein [Flagellimonas lutaonensis]|uniref:TIGR02453 family protein n=1 Tax=Flagellimonas lutaonensis TaxID=516051 RepID=A0A0D5YNS7_9FLAO|nr:DUF2461 domain-containing protein [Allomuricauda lutaonensis]AKA33882.1 hypothetical protein VC82_193 [Allomuricauda lutaonensis]
MNFENLFNFLTALQKNNNKEWMDAHRKHYHQFRNDFIAWLDGLDAVLAEKYKGYYPTPGKMGINRINNNLMFHPNKPIYKDHFGAGLDKAPNSADFYIHIGINECMLAGGFWRPDHKTLCSIREAIDYNGEEFVKVINKKSFKETFGELYKDEKLINAPKGFSNNHEHIDLLRNKSFAVAHEMSRKMVLAPYFDDHVLKVYEEMLPFRQYLNKAVTV